MKITDRQKEILEFLVKFISDNSYPPTIREIQHHFNLASTKGVKDHLDRLEEKGYIKRRSNSARAIEILNFPEFGPSVKNRIIDIPVLGQVAAGVPLLARENVIAHVELPQSIVKSREVFFLQVKGESMKGAGILPGDLLLVCSQPFVEQGEIAVALVGEEATVKKFYRREESIELQAENPDFPVQVYGPDDEVKIIGKVIAVLRSLENSAF